MHLRQDQKLTLFSGPDIRNCARSRLFGLKTIVQRPNRQAIYTSLITTKIGVLIFGNSAIFVARWVDSPIPQSRPDHGGWVFGKGLGKILQKSLRVLVSPLDPFTPAP